MGGTQAHPWLNRVEKINSFLGAPKSCLITYSSSHCCNHLKAYCQAQPKPESSWAELAIKSHSDTNNRVSIK